MANMRYQPQGLTRVNPSSPIARGLESVVTLAGQVRDAVSGIQWSVVNGTVPLAYGGAPRGRGVAVTKASTPSYVSRTQPSAITSSSSQPLTFRYRLFFTAMPPSSVSGGVLQWADTASSGAPRYYARISGQANGTGILDFYFMGGYRAPLTLTTGTEYVIHHTFNGLTHNVYLNGVFAYTFGGTWGDNPGSFFLGRGFHSPDGAFLISDFAALSRELSAREVKLDADNLWQIFDALDEEDFVVASAPASVTGTLAATLPAPTMSATGLLVNAGAFAATLAAPTMSASGIAATPPSGAFAATMAAPSMSAAGIATNYASFAATMAAPTMAATGTAAPHATGTLAVTMPAPTMNAFGYLGGVEPVPVVRRYRWRILRRNIP